MAHVLIIDDDHTGVAPLAEYLRAQGHETVHAPTAESAMPHLRRQPDLVLLDLGMPGVDGLELLRALSDDARFEELRIVVFSGTTDPTVISECRRLGACDFLWKGQGLAELQIRVSQLLRSEPASQELSSSR